MCTLMFGREAEHLQALTSIFNVHFKRKSYCLQNLCDTMKANVKRKGLQEAMRIKADHSETIIEQVENGYRLEHRSAIKNKELYALWIG